MSTNTSKKVKRGNRKVDHQEDRLSDLPNEILVIILSCLKTREAVRSGILSTRWKSVWVSVPVLDLNQSDFKIKGERSDGDNKREKARFVYFMDQVLIARKMPFLEKISICGKKCDPFLVRSWMRAALERDANELTVKFFDISAAFRSPRCELTHNLFSHNKLVILKLCVGMTLNFQANTCGFPNLKLLQLDSIKHEKCTSLPNLLSSCPLLEDLIIIRGRDCNLMTFINLISCSVKRLKVYNKCNIHGNRRVVVGGYNRVMVIDAPAVESLNLKFVGDERFSVKDMTSIVDAQFDFIDLSAPSKTFKLLRAVSNVRFLRLSHCTGKTIVHPNALNAYDCLLFNNLTRVDICGSDDSSNYKIIQWELLLKILKCSPILENLIYQASSSDSASECGKSSNWGVPNCLVSSLKTVEFNNFSKSDVKRVRYILLNAQVLEKMTIRIDSDKVLIHELCKEIFKNEKKSITMTWSRRKVIISFL